MAVGHKIIIAAYHILKNKEAYKEPVLHNSPKHKSKKIKTYLNMLKDLGIEVEIKQVSKNIKAVFYCVAVLNQHHEYEIGITTG